MSITSSLTANNATSANLQSQIAAANNDATNADADKTTADYQDFLLLLTAQLKNQDPLEPLDSTTFVSQLAQFSNVEQQVKMNDKLDGLVSNLTGSDFSEASNYLGKKVIADGGKIHIDETDTETQFHYQTDSTAKSVQAIISDRFGKDLHTIPLPLAPNGRNQDWDLKDDTNQKIASGIYNVTIKTTNDDGIVTSNPAKTKVDILQVQKTNTGFEFLTDTEQKLSIDDIQSVYAS
ncbi:MAG: flagellar basal-body rod modification protein FlgD [Alphaproteobacteria bacterium]|jgi:flagellar basal-body rod modification protein FlgD